MWVGGLEFGVVAHLPVEGRDSNEIGPSVDDAGDPHVQSKRDVL